MKKSVILSMFLLFSASAFCEPGVYWGAFLGDNTTATSAGNFDVTAGKKMAQVMWFIDWNSDFPVALCSVLYKNGYIPHITWEPWLYSDKNAINLDKILNGQFDSYIKNFAGDAKKYGNTVLLRVGHEFNGDWYPWCVSKNGNDPEKFKKAWVHIHDIFTAEGASNVRWVWCPNSGSGINAQWNDPLLAYPGDSYVDWVGIDGYNFGTYQNWSSWATFEDVFRPMYEKLSKKLGHKPFMVGEFACADKGGDKALWISGLEKELKKFPLIRCVTWFNVNKEMDWRISSSPEALKAFQRTISSPYFLSSSTGLESVTTRPDKNDGSSPLSKISKQAVSKKPLLIVRQVANAVIDGVRGEKTNGDVVTIGRSKIYMGYDSNNVYLYADIYDETPGENNKKGGEITNGDALEIALSTDPSADPARTAPARYDFLIAIKASDDTETYNYAKKAPVTNPIVFYKKNDKGCIIEAFIPWYNFDTGCFCRIKNKAIAFDAAIDNADKNGKIISRERWTGNENFGADPSQWGQIIFSTK
jgi:beta-mannanase